ncbi:MAG: hypothetical protein EBY01_04625 [Actinobacteria bacterium]|nr:hypothetical protein [Actinomycetota bacterium]
MSISVITYLQDAEFEDQVIEALISKGISEVRLEYRAIDVNGLVSFLDSLPRSDLRWILILDQTISSIEFKRAVGKHPNLITCNLDSDISMARREIESVVNRSLREFDNHEEPRRTVKTQPKLIVVTGTTGAPGVTTLTMNLGFEISQSKKVSMIDAHPERRDLAFLLGAKRSSEKVKLSESLSISSEYVQESELTQLVDAGPIPDLTKAFSDRRAKIRNYVDLLESAERIIFLMTPDNNHMFEMENLLASLDAGRLNARGTFLLNQMGNSSRERSIKKRFQARVGNYSSYCLPFDRDALDRAKGRYCALMDIAPRSRLRRAISEVANSVVE